jgi:biopolymer transport protein ExbB/TolQ
VTDQLVEALYVVSIGLMTPTLIVLVVMMVNTLAILGGLAREAIERSKMRPLWRRYMSELQCDKARVDMFWNLKLTGYLARFQFQTRDVADDAIVFHKIRDDLEIDITGQLSKLAFGTRLGPMLGLVGTLIPLGPALTGLAAGDIHALSGNLVIAFTTTVFGILIGGFSYAAGLIRRNWYERDLSDLEFVLSLRFSHQSVPGHPQSATITSERPSDSIHAR